MKEPIVGLLFQKNYLYQLSTAVPTCPEETPARQLELLKGIAQKTGRDWGNQRDITPEQAKALAIFAFEAGYTDMNFTNVLFTEEGKLAIIDTEPQKRYFIKKFANCWDTWLFGDANIARITQSFVGTAKLKLWLRDPKAMQEVQKIERWHLTLHAVKQVAKIILTVGIYFAVCAYYRPNSIPLLPHSLVLRVVYWTAAIRIGVHCIQMLNLTFTVFLNSLGLPGVCKMEELEKEGQL